MEVVRQGGAWPPGGSLARNGPRFYGSGNPAACRNRDRGPLYE